MTRTPIAAIALPAAMALAAISIAPSAAHAQAGSYQQSCRAVSAGGGRLSAECKASDGRYRQSSIDAGKCKGDIGNQNGVLACNGATAQGGGFVSGDRGGANNDRGRTDDRGGERRNDNNPYDHGRDGRGGAGGRDDHGLRGPGGRAFHGGYAGGGGYNHPRPGLILYPGPNYSGRGFEVWDSIENLRREGFNDRASSARVVFGDWKLCRNAGYGGCEHINRSAPDLRALHIDGSVSSVERK